MSQSFRRELVELAACSESLVWLGRRGRLRAWRECPYGDWLLWYLETRGLDCRHAAYWCIERARQAVVAAFPHHDAARSVAACVSVRNKTTARKIRDVTKQLLARQVCSKELFPAVFTLRWAATTAVAGRPTYLVAGETANVAWHLALGQRRRARDADCAAVADYVRLHYEQAFLGLERADLR